MRLQLELKIHDGNNISANYNYPLSAAIYKLLKLGSNEFSTFLHDIGYKNAGKTYKLFTFALRFSNFKINYDIITLLNSSCKLFMSTPLIEEFVENFVLGSFHEQKIEIVDNGIKTLFYIEKIETLKKPSLKPPKKFIMLSPLILSTKVKNSNRLEQYYFRYNDPINEINRVMNNNLMNKYELIHNRKYEGNGISLKWDENYIKRMEAKKKRITKKVTVRKNDLLKIDLIGNQLPFEIKGDTELIKVGYDCGFGEKNSLGFGLVDVM